MAKIQHLQFNWQKKLAKNGYSSGFSSFIARNFNIKSVVPEFFIPRANDNELDEVNDKQTTCINDGQFIKTCSNKLLKKLIPDIDFTPLDEGIRQTCLWYKNNKLVTKHINNSSSTVSYI